METMRLFWGDEVVVDAAGVRESVGEVEVQEVMKTLRARKHIPTLKYSLELMGILSILLSTS
jgi:hypothetical protein